MAAAQGATLRVKDFQDFMRALAIADRKDARAIRDVLRHAGDTVKRDAVQEVDPVDSRSAAGYRTYVRQRGVGVEQSLRKTTGLHPEWGRWQMRHALIPALEANEDSTARDMERALDQVAIQFNRGGAML
jgi:hypothetical protein